MDISAPSITIGFVATPQNRLIDSLYLEFFWGVQAQVTCSLLPSVGYQDSSSLG